MTKVAVFSESVFTVEGHGVHSAFTECTNMLASIPDIEVVSPIFLKRSDILHVHSAGPIALALLAAHSGPRVVTAHLTPSSFIGSVAFAEVTEQVIDRYLRFFYSKADLVLAVSDTVLQYLNSTQISTPIQLLPNVIDCHAIEKICCDYTSPGEEPKKSIRRSTVIGVGQIQPRKGVDAFIECAWNMPDVDFVWVGGFLFGALSAERDRLEKIIANAPKNIIFAGKVPRQRVFEYYAQADIFFLPSEQETFGLAALEAAAAGLPLVLRDLPTYGPIFGDAYIATDGSNNSESLRQLISDRERRSDYGARAKRAASNYDWAVGAQELVRAYDRALGISRRRLCGV
jgi:1,2-diacylglycerol-3-alpha-glucose alpha-1,2-galactosyltransferase